MKKNSVPNKRHFVIKLFTLSAMCIILVFALIYWNKFTPNRLQHEESDQTELITHQENEILDLRAQLSWYRWYFSEYAAAMRLEQYGVATDDINDLLAENSERFLPIESVTYSTICPASSNGAYGNDFIYFGARILPLTGEDDTSFYAMSYLGSAGFAHSGQAFDALIAQSAIAPGLTRLEAPFGLLDSWLAEHNWKDFSFTGENDYGYSAVMSYNSGDIDQDGFGDFILNRSLILSSLNYSVSGDAPRRAIFLDDRIVSISDGHLRQWIWNGQSLIEVSALPLVNPNIDNTPYALLPLPDNNLAVRTADGFDVYRFAGENLSYYASVGGLVAGEMQTGAFGDFDQDGQTDFWLSQIATPTPYPGKNDRLSLIRMSDIQPGSNALDQIVYFSIKGSDDFSDYDGISTTLSPRAGDLDNDGIPDISFTGHRHMNESGAMYILLGNTIIPRGEIDITDEVVIKILGPRMGQLAPPFHHWDATDYTGDGIDDVLVPSDNDLCSGLNAGAIYVLDGAKIVQLALGH